MTGYGRASRRLNDKTFMVELRSLNSKYTDLRLRAPQSLREKEISIRKQITEFAQRGKLELNIDLRSADGEGDFALNLPLFRRYFKEIKNVADELGMPTGDLAAAIVRLPNVVAADTDDWPDEEWKVLQETIKECLKNFQEFRRQEGAVLAEEMRGRVIIIQELLETVTPFEEGRIVTMRARIAQNLEDFLGKSNVDKNRYEQEVLFYLEKMDITEEKVRLAQHCDYFLKEMDANKEVKGRKLSFISQEIGREINTLGAKANSPDIQRIVVNMKDELEKIKEQLANVV